MQAPTRRSILPFFISFYFHLEKAEEIKKKAERERAPFLRLSLFLFFQGDINTRKTKRGRGGGMDG